MSDFELKGNQVWIGDRRVGWITTTMDGKKVFVSARKKSHYFRMFEGYAIARSVLEFLQRNQFDEIQLRFGKREMLVSSLHVWFKQGQPYHKKTEFEPQLVLNKKYMKRKVLMLSEVME